MLVFNQGILSPVVRPSLYSLFRASTELSHLTFFPSSHFSTVSQALELASPATNNVQKIKQLSHLKRQNPQGSIQPPPEISLQVQYSPSLGQVNPPPVLLKTSQRFETCPSHAMPLSIQC